MLQVSLEMQHERCVEVCIAQAAPVKSVKLIDLYDQLFDETNPDLADIVAHFDGQPRAFLAYQALTSGRRCARCRRSGT